MDTQDKSTWVGGKEGVFSIKYAYNYLQNY